jgi:5-oxoprolinase (ATP-hydrolysing) subunit A
VPGQVALTTDIGEGLGRWSLGDDEALLEVVTGANIACGFHAGDPGIMRRTCATAVANGVSIGAQVSYRDLHGFGRRYIAMPGPELTDDLLYQLGALQVFARLAGGQVDYVRAHGALYNVAATDTEHARAIVDASQQFDLTLPLLCQLDTEAWRLGEECGLRLVSEAFVDRGYTAEGLLQPRDQPGALIEDADEAAARAVRMVTEGLTTAVDGTEVKIRAEALVVHSDTPNAVAIARATRSALETAGVELVPLR